MRARQETRYAQARLRVKSIDAMSPPRPKPPYFAFPLAKVIVTTGAEMSNTARAPRGANRVDERRRHELDVVVSHVRIERQGHDALRDVVRLRELAGRPPAGIRGEPVNRRVVHARLDPRGPHALTNLV